MELKTKQIKGNVKIFIFADLRGWENTETSIKEKILNTPFDYWELDSFNSVLCDNSEILEVFVYTLGNEVIFNVNEIL